MKTDALHTAFMAAKDTHFLPAPRIPEAHRPVGSCGGDKAAVGAVTHLCKLAAQSAKALRQLTGAHVPQADLVAAGSRDQAAVRAPADACDAGGEMPNQLLRVGVPYPRAFPPAR